MRTWFLFLAALAALPLAAAADGAIPNRLSQAKVGEWVIMQNVSGEGAGEKMKVTVIGVDENAVTIKREQFEADGRPGEVVEQTIPFSRYAERLAGLEDMAKQIGRERLAIGDRELSVTAVSWDGEPDEDGLPHEFKIWVSEDLPVGGIAKTWSSSPDFPAAEVVEYGF